MKVRYIAWHVDMLLYLIDSACIANANVKLMSEPCHLNY